jgi:hypothetical protein
MRLNPTECCNKKAKKGMAYFVKSAAERTDRERMNEGYKLKEAIYNRK